MTDTRELGLGVPELDVEHELQLQLVHAVRSALDRGEADEAREALERLDSYTNAHFLAEQLLMRLHSYPAYQAHVQEHDFLIAQLRQLARDLDQGNARFGGIAERLEPWLRTHIATADLAFAGFLKQRRSLPAD